MTYFTGNFQYDEVLMFELLDSLYLRTGNERSGSKFFGRNAKRKAESMKLGWTFRKKCGTNDRVFDEEKGLYQTVLLSENPGLMDLFREYSNFHFFNFEWTEITINKMPTGTNIKMHLDKVNVGDSILIAYGEYSGGNTFIQEGQKFRSVDARLEPVIFNGSQLNHYVNTVTKGDRYSLVFYKNKYKKMNIKK